MEFSRILPHIYHVQFDDNYDLAMHFIRYQEYYENLKFRNQLVTLVDYMEWYSKDQGEGCFSYPEDWAGFNVPSNVLLEVSRGEIPDPNKYDTQMKSLIDAALQEEGDHRFYFIGTCSDSVDVAEDLDHEIAHALYFIDEEYREVMEGLLDAMPQENYEAAWKSLQEMRYHPIVCRDEVHAYSATGPHDDLKQDLPLRVRRPFIKAYKEQRERTGG